MILKIARYSNEQDWWMLDDIRKISKGQFIQPFTKDFTDHDADIFILDYVDYLDIKGAAQESRNVIKLICRLSDGSEFIVLFDTLAYLLNDNGKTIEKIVANY
ncbi:hypothetical protein LCGC14_1007540 [marine sediment metagenome]|uniref:Uncharacterized protein n=1 Tax=marine sediment metagenome TaxID=412755 RepID=A0A0F9QJK8_9ZZZZ